MRYDWNTFKSRKKQTRRELGRKLAKIRWQRDRERRDKLAAIEAESNPSRIVRRLVIIDNERDVRELVLWSWETWRDWRRKLKVAQINTLP